MKIKVLGMGCKNCERLEENIKEAVRNLRLDADIEKIEDIEQISAYSVMKTPGLVVDGKVILTGQIPSSKKLMRLLSKHQS